MGVNRARAHASAIEPATDTDTMTDARQSRPPQPMTIEADMPMIGAISGAIIMAPITTAVELSSRPIVATMIESVSRTLYCPTVRREGRIISAVIAERRSSADKVSRWTVCRCSGGRSGSSTPTTASVTALSSLPRCRSPCRGSGQE